MFPGRSYVSSWFGFGGIETKLLEHSSSHSVLLSVFGMWPPWETEASVEMKAS